MILTACLVVCALLGGSDVSCRGTVMAPVERAAFSQVTSYDSLQAFLNSLQRSPMITLDTIAHTREGRTVSVVKVSSSRVFGSDRSKLRILLFAQQHGDEPSGKEALTLLLARLVSEDGGDLLKALDILAVPQMNPDGAERHRRRTSDTIDLNRNHVLLTSPETRGLHDLFFRWRPEVTLDLHEYGSFSRSWSDSGFIKTGDVQFGMLTNLNTSGALRQYQRRRVFPHIAQAMERQGYSFHEYIVGSPSDRIRHSTTEINDGRQSFGILNTLSFIQEGRKWRSIDDQLERRARSQLAAMQALLEFCAEHADEIRSLVTEERESLGDLVGTEAVLWMDHESGGGTLQIPVQDVRTGRDTVWQIRPYHDVVRPRIVGTVPSAYVVSREDSSIISLLERHHVVSQTVETPSRVHSHTLMIDSVSFQELEEDTLPRVHVCAHADTIALLPGDRVVPTSQWHALFLVSVLEPESSWGIMKYREFEGLLKRSVYPIHRLP